MDPTLILTANPHSADLVRAEIEQAHPQNRILNEIATGVWGVKTAVSFFTLAEQWHQSPPIFTRHICPVHEIIPITGEAKDIPALERIIKSHFLDLMEPDLAFSVQTRVFDQAAYKPFDLNSTISDTIQKISGAPLNVRQPEQVLSIVIGGEVAYLGLSLARHNLSDWAGGVHRFAREKGQISRAEFKLLEAFAVFGIELPPRGIALDLGAAPGGWTRVLRQRDQYVTAVDPADLDPALLADSKVRHKRMTAEDYLAEIPDKFDIIVNDMRQDARDSARLLASFSPYLYPQGAGIMSFKLPESGKAQIIDHAFNILQKSYRIAAARQLFHNRNEITVYLRK